MTYSLDRWLPITCLAWFLLAPAAASGQTTSERWPGLSPTDLQTVYLQDRSGAETSGKLVGLDGDSLVLLVDGTEHRFDRADVARIQKRDTLKNGTLIGAAVGVAMGLVAAGISDCPGDDPGGSCAGLRTWFFLSSVGIYAGLGAGVDVLIRGRTTIYDASASAVRPRSAAGASPGGLLQIGFSW